jgi:hypothetical protein
MAQHIGLQREDEHGDVLEWHVAEGIPTELLELAPATSACVRFIDPHGDTVFNQLQLPILIAEVRSALDKVSDPSRQAAFSALIRFLEASREGHIYVRFVGD